MINDVSIIHSILTFSTEKKKRVEFTRGIERVIQHRKKKYNTTQAEILIFFLKDGL